MAVLIGHAAIDENGNVIGGAAGDQTGKEVCTREWYAKGWTQLVRPKTPALAEKIAATMEAACKNDNIGYDQSGRLTLYDAAKAVNFDLSKIKTKVECDCSALVGVCVIAGGVNITPNIYTGNMTNALKSTGKFDVMTASKYLTSSDYLKRGDILVKPYDHTVVVLSNGSKANADSGAVTPTPTDTIMYAESFDASIKGQYKVTTDLYLRRGAGTGYKFITVLPEKATVHNYGYYTMVGSTKWLYVAWNGYVGFCSSKYLKKA